MDKDYVEYDVQIQELYFPEDIKKIKIKSIYDDIEEIYLCQSPDKSITKVKFYFNNNIKNENKAKEITKKALEKILHKISFELSCYVGDEKIKKIKLDNNIKTYGEDSIFANLKVPTDEKSLEKLKQTLENSSEYSRYHKFYHEALKSKNKVVKFMFLYNILLQIFDDSQKKVENFIKNNLDLSKEKLTQSPIGDFKETIFTRLRNEVAHKRENTNYINSKNEIINNLEELTLLVKKAIKQNYV